MIAILLSSKSKITKKKKMLTSIFIPACTYPLHIAWFTFSLSLAFIPVGIKFLYECLSVALFYFSSKFQF